MITYPNAKVNLGLNITEKRPDGYHNIETLFIPVPKLCDILEIIPQAQQIEPLVFTQSGLSIAGDTSQNLCVKAYYLLNSQVVLPSVKMHLHKQIPMGAGLGGGSADGAFALNMLNQMAKSPLSQSVLAELALELGSDCPFFLINQTCFGKGRGEQLTSVELPVKGLYIVIVYPSIHVNTGQAFRKAQPKPSLFDLQKVNEVPVEIWRNFVSNDFESIVFSCHPAIERIKENLYRLGAVYSSMSGSGSTVFGLFKDIPVLSDSFHDYFTHTSQL